MMEARHYTTVCMDKYGRYYDLRYEHPSWEEKKKGIVVSIVRNAFTCTVEEADRLTKRKGRPMKKKPEPPPCTVLDGQVDR